MNGALKHVGGLGEFQINHSHKFKKLMYCLVEQFRDWYQRKNVAVDYRFQLISASEKLRLFQLYVLSQMTNLMCTK
jgi:hypothetical protein